MSLTIRAKRLVPLVLLALCTAHVAEALGNGCIGCDSPPAPVAPRNHVPARSLLLWSSGELRPPAPAQPVYVAPAALPRVARSDSHTGSTNAYVSPWGCEAATAQDVSSGPGYYYWGKYQFDRQTWAAHGGNPAAYGSASEAEQDAVASRVTYDAWPNC